MKIKTFYIDSIPVKSLKIDGRNVPIGGEEPDYFYVSGQVAAPSAFLRAPKVNVTFTKSGTVAGFRFEYSTDGTTWTTGSIGTAMTISNTASTVKPFTIFIRAPQGPRNFGTATSTSNYLSISITGNISGDVFVGGNIMTLIDGTGQAVELPSEFTFANLFKDCTTLTDASDLVLPAKIMTTGCYSYMFRGCTKLKIAPALPATTLADYCYYGMFYDCTALTLAPELPVTALASDCYSFMFRGCTSLNNVKVAFTQWSPTNATSNWLPSNAGTFTCPLDLITNTSTRYPDTVPSSWTMVADV